MEPAYKYNAASRRSVTVSKKAVWPACQAEVFTRDLHMTQVDDRAIDLKPLARILDSSEPISQDGLVPVLQAIQAEYGYLPATALGQLSRHTSIPAARIYGVATFYEQFHLEPRGRHTIRCCRGTACHVKGGREIVRTVSRALNAQPGETTDDMRYSFETVACLGTCFLAPAMMVDSDYYGHLTPDRIKGILERYT